MPEKRGKLIVIEGIDGSGKTKQTELLMNRLLYKGYNAETLDFPQYNVNFFGKLVGKYLSGKFGDPTKIHPVLSSMLYAGDRWESKPKLEEWIEQGKIVVLNRYKQSNEGHQGGKIGNPEKRQDFLGLLDEMEYQIFGIPVPDRVLFLHVNPEIAQKLVDKKSERDYIKRGKRDGHEASMSHLKHALNSFISIANKNPELWRIVYCTDETKKNILPPGIIHKKVWNALEDLLPPVNPVAN
jgi:dTMP kinase